MSDGYTDSRVVKYDKNGRFIKSIGTRGNGVNQFSTPHGIAADAQGNVYVADRGNSRIVVLDNDLNWKTTYENVGAPWGICISQSTPQYLYSTAIRAARTWRSATRPITGEIYKMQLDGKVARPVRQGGQSAAGVRQHPHARLPEPERSLRGRDQRLARAEGDAAPDPGPTSTRKLGGHDETLLHDSVGWRRCAVGASIARSRSPN